MSGPSNNAAREAQRTEDARQAAITATQGRVNQVFDSPQRQADIDSFVGDLRQFYTRDLDEQKGNSDRELKFALARSGQTGGSTQIDQQRDSAKAYSKGLLNIDQRALGAGADLQAADQDSRSRLIQLATSGLDATTAASQASAAMRSSLQAGKSTAQTQGLGDVFSQFRTFTDRAREASERRRGLGDSGLSLYQPMNYGGT